MSTREEPSEVGFRGWVAQIADRINEGTALLSRALQGELRLQIGAGLEVLRKAAAREYCQFCADAELPLWRGDREMAASRLFDGHLRASFMLLSGTSLELCLSGSQSVWSGQDPAPSEAGIRFSFGEGNCGIAVMRAWNPTGKEGPATLSIRDEAGEWPTNLSTSQLRAISPDLDWVLSAPVRLLELPIGVVNLDGLRWKSIAGGDRSGAAATLRAMVAPARVALGKVLLDSTGALGGLLDRHVRETRP